MTRPGGTDAQRMLEPGGWPEFDEDILYDRAREYTRALRQVTDVLETCQQQRLQIFEGGIWSGGGANAARRALDGDIDRLMKLQRDIVTAIAVHDKVAGAIGYAKSAISDNVEAAQQQITVLRNDPSWSAAARDAAIETIVGTAHGVSASVVADTAEQIRAMRTWTPPDSALERLLSQKSPPADRPVPVQHPPRLRPPKSQSPGGHRPPRPQPPEPVTSSAHVIRQHLSGTTPPSLGQPLASSAYASPSLPVAMPRPASGAQSMSRTASAAPGVPVGWPAGSTAAPAARPGRGGEQAPRSATPRSRRAPPVANSSTPTTPTTETGAPSALAGPRVPAVSDGANSGPSAGWTAPVRPADASPTGQQMSSGVGPARTNTARTEAGHRATSAGPAAVPVAAARAERDAIAAGAVAEPARRRAGGGKDPLRLARHIAAALNAPDSGGQGDFGFFWVVGVTTEGAIVLANSYGVAYIPERVQLPEAACMASADEGIPVTERARWATRPALAVQAWAAHHDHVLRAIIATAEQFAGSDTGVPTVMLTSDDIPTSGGMTGRTRLQVVDPAAAARLASTTDARLPTLLPPTQVVVSPPADRRRLWFNVMTPVVRKAPGRETAHLQALRTYAAYSHSSALWQAHTTVDVGVRRGAVADSLYWQHLRRLLDSALINP
ncbi:hypothetical protein [Mycobacterium decipiens]|nr:hypothetical protein [Mycobacterium decipiens]